MNRKVLAFGASNSRQSINKQFAIHAAKSISDANVEAIDLNDFEMPLYSIDREKESGIPNRAHDFKSRIHNADAIVISFAEHNGAYTVAFKNIFDWVSRIDSNVWMDKPMLLLATSPGKRGGKTVLEIATNKFRFMNKAPIQSFSLPSFFQNFSSKSGIMDPELSENFQSSIHAFVVSLDHAQNIAEPISISPD